MCNLLVWLTQRTFRQRTELTTAQRDILTALGIDAPKKIIELGPLTGNALTSTNLTAWTHLSGGAQPFPQLRPQIPCPGPTSAAEPGAELNHSTVIPVGLDHLPGVEVGS